jgi:gas vesicle protein
VVKSQAVAASILGAVVGGIAWYLFFTDEGRSLRRRLEPALDDLARELGNFRDTIHKAADVVNESLKLLNEAVGEEQRSRYPSLH